MAVVSLQVPLSPTRERREHLQCAAVVVARLLAQARARVPTRAGAAAYAATTPLKGSGILELQLHSVVSVRRQPAHKRGDVHEKLRSALQMAARLMKRACHQMSIAEWSLFHSRLLWHRQ